jgi:DhnA family fructose-bisphosphate aldolase class Ia
VSSASAADVVLAIVSEKTGYPADMLGLSMEMESELGIDSIKQVEILAALQTHFPGAPEVHAQCVDNILRLKPEADYYGMPMMVEPLVFRPNAEAGGYMVDGDLTKITHLVRQAVELGADIIKADPTDDVSQYHKVIEIASGIPVLVRGGGRVSDEEILRRTRDLIAQGASGIVYGRNVIQHPDPKKITQQLMEIVHA